MPTELIQQQRHYQVTKQFPSPPMPKGIWKIEVLKSKVQKEPQVLCWQIPIHWEFSATLFLKLQKLFHQAGGLLYYDGPISTLCWELYVQAIWNSMCMHLNLHKTFSTPHGGCGPGAGPVLCKDKFWKNFLPLPRVEKDRDVYNVVGMMPKASEDSFHFMAILPFC